MMNLTAPFEVPISSMRKSRSCAMRDIAFGMMRASTPEPTETFTDSLRSMIDLYVFTKKGITSLYLSDIKKITL